VNIREGSIAGKRDGSMPERRAENMWGHENLESESDENEKGAERWREKERYKEKGGRKSERECKRLKSFKANKNRLN
jgi:hypothetical protein